ncbi:MAG: DUF86 domain-containing protein [Aquificaceae bacterium]
MLRVVITKSLQKNELLVCAVIRCIEVIGEAVKNLSKELTGKYPDIPWKEMAGMRDFLIHKYYDVDLEIVWDTIKAEIPQAKPLIEKVLIDIEG